MKRLTRRFSSTRILVSLKVLLIPIERLNKLSFTHFREPIDGNKGWKVTLIAKGDGHVGALEHPGARVMPIERVCMR